MTFHNNPIWLSVLLVVAAVSLAVGPLASAPAQTEKLKMVLESMDADGDGDLDPREVSPRLQKYLQSKGVDTSKSSSINKILKRVGGNSEAANSKRNAQLGQLKVPGFGVEQDQPQSKILSFSTEAKRIVDPKIAEKAKKRAQETLGRYDRNGDNILNQEETKRFRWGSPSPQESDTNRDGMLSLQELSRRYEDRYAAEQKERQRKDNERSDGGRRDRDRPVRDEGNDARQALLKSLNASYKNNVATANARTGSARASDNSKYEKYAEGLIKRYDKNKNGWLDKDEVAKMRRPPKEDPNNDGRITKAELIAMNSPKSAVVSPKSKTTKKSSARGSSRGRDSSKGKSVFGGKDKNEDQQIQMSEFADRWTEKTVNEFNKIDTNGDAVISVDEWLKK